MKCPKCGSEDITFARWQLHPAFYCCNCRWFFTDWQQSQIDTLKAQLSEQSETVQRDWLSPVETAALRQRLEEAELLTRKQAIELAEIAERCRKSKGPCICGMHMAHVGGNEWSGK